MKTRQLPPSFYRCSALQVAPDLLYCRLAVRDSSGKIKRLTISETEAYVGEEDLACHASRGRTKRTEVMYQEGGVFYVYLIYGMYYMLNVVTAVRDRPEAVLIRGAREVSGPGRLTRDLQLGGELNGRPVTQKSGVWIEEKERPPKRIRKGPRVGVSYAGAWADKLYRFIGEDR